jgi:hypothetical protein
MTESILRKPEVRRRIPVGHTKFEEDIAPRLDKVFLGPRCVGFTESSVERLIKELITESAAHAAKSAAAAKDRSRKITKREANTTAT